MSADAISIRAAREGDARALAKAWYHGEARSLEEGYPDGYPREWFWMESIERLDDAWVRSLVSPQPFVQIFVAEQSGNCAGFAQASSSEAAEDLGALKSLYVHPDAWGYGCGSALHDAVVDALGRSFDRAELWVIEGNRRARGFYERRGWTHDGGFMRTPNGLPLVRYLRAVP